MAEPDGLSAIEVDADDYAEAAAGDTPSVSRTFQSEADFQAQKASYTAKHDGGNNLENLLDAVPALRREQPATNGNIANSPPAVTLGKRDVQLVNYAVGEMYYDRKYLEIVELCRTLRTTCQLDRRTQDTIERWSERCEQRIKSASAGP